MKYPFIVIEGNIGVGKTTISKLLASRLEADLLLEKFRRNYFLPLFYSNMAKYGLHVELSFLLDRLDDVSQQEESQRLVADYFFTKTLLFAQMNLDKHALKIFEMVYRKFERHARQPDLVIYLRRDISKVMQQIKERGRKNEMKIKRDYLEGVQRAYDEYFQSNKTQRILWLDVGDLDFKKTPALIENLAQLVTKNYKKGITRKRLHN